MKVLEFYRNVIKSLGLRVTEDDFIKIVTKDTSTLLTVSGKPLIIPSKGHLDTIMAKNDDGELEVTKLPYNPLNENVVRGNSASITTTKMLVEKQLAHIIAGAGELLLRLAMNEKMQSKTNMHINTFLMRLKEAKTTGVKDAVNEVSIKNWGKLYEKTYTTKHNFIKVFLKKASPIEGVKFNRVATYNSEVYEELLNADKTTPVWGVKLRPKDITVFKIILEFILNIDEEKQTVSYGSNDSESPAFISLYRTYLSIVTNTNKILKSLKVLDTETYDSCYRELNISDIELDALNIYKGDLITLPNEIDLNRDRTAKVTAETSLANSMSTATSGINLPIADNQPTMVPATQQAIHQPVTQQQITTPVQETDVTKSLVDKILYGNGTFNAVQPSYSPGTQTQTQTQPAVVMPQQQMYGMNQNIVPMGINSNPNIQPNMVMPQQQMYPVNQIQQPIIQMQQPYNMTQPQVTPMNIAPTTGYRFQ